MSNVDRLSQAGIVDRDALSADQVKFINNDLTIEEVEDLIKIGKKIALGYGKHHNTHACTMTITV
jgi:hypothetical protein